MLDRIKRRLERAKGRWESAPSNDSWFWRLAWDGVYWEARLREVRAKRAFVSGVTDDEHKAMLKALKDITR